MHRPPAEYDEIFTFENGVSMEQRKQRLSQLFNEYLIPFSALALTRAGIRQLVDEGHIYVKPHIMSEIERLSLAVRSWGKLIPHFDNP